MHWDYIAILAILAVFVPWRSTARIQTILGSSALESRGRLTLYVSTILFQWAAVAIIFWRLVAHRSDLQQLGLTIPSVPRAILATAVLSTLLVLNQVFSIRRLATLPHEKRGLIAQLADKLLPRCRREATVAVLLVVTVAICEEFIYRGFIQTLFQQTFSSVAAGAAISAVFFAIAHLYQGRKGTLTTFFVGLLFSGVRIWTGSLWPSILIHFSVDFSAGLAAVRLFPS